MKRRNHETEKVVMDSIVEYIFQTHKFPSVAKISEMTRINRVKCAEICSQLVKKNKLYTVFEGKGVPTVYVPYDMMQSLLMTQKKPGWVSNYSFKEEIKLTEKARHMNDQLIAFDTFKRLIYATDIPLEEAVAFALNWLGFKNVIHFKDNTDNPDITFEYNSKKVLVEVEGTTKAGGKAKILQLDGWLRREIDKGIKANELQGIFVINHFRDVEPSSRGDPLTPHAKEFLKRYNFRFFTTPFLFDVIKRVKEDKLSKKEARKIVWQGQKIA
jgi:hypothetical protein